MFEIFEHINELVLVFKDNKLTYANETALVHLKCMRETICEKDIKFFYDEKYVEKMLLRLETEKDFKMSMKQIGKRPIQYRIREIIDSYNEKYIMMQAIRPNEIKTLDFEKIVAPRITYDPLMAGKASILNYEITEPYMELKYMIDTLINENKDNYTLKETAEKLDDYYSKTRQCVDRLMDIESRYDISRSLFSVHDLLLKIKTKLNNYFKIENIKAEINYRSCKYGEPVICADFYSLSKVIVTLITHLTKNHIVKNKYAKVNLTLKKDDKYAYIYIKGVDIIISKKTYNDIISKDIEIISPESHHTEKLTVNLQMISTFVGLNGGELMIKRNIKTGTEILLKFPLAKKRYFVCEVNRELPIDDTVDNLISVSQYPLKINRFYRNLKVKNSDTHCK